MNSRRRHTYKQTRPRLFVSVRVRWLCAGVPQGNDGRRFHGSSFAADKSFGGQVGVDGTDAKVRGGGFASPLQVTRGDQHLPGPTGNLPALLRESAMEGRPFEWVAVWGGVLDLA